CREGGRSLSQSSDLVEQQRLQSREKPYRCLECGKSFRQSSFVIQHEMSHAGEQP
ncbi:ZNF22 protein, partial [Sclerurus mexicanus]|nr:ZNF22 protein [Sclerurus mexicanus]